MIFGGVNLFKMLKFAVFVYTYIYTSDISVSCRCIAGTVFETPNDAVALING